MRISFKTLVKRDFNTVVNGFNRDLFEYLVPSYCLAVLERYDGQEHGDMVHLSFRLPGINDWKVVVKDTQKTEKNYWFIHRGLTMPLGLIFWQHMHRVVSLGKNKCAIVDYIQFESKWIFLDYIHYMLLFLIFIPRKILYRRYFNKLGS